MIHSEGGGRTTLHLGPNSSDKLPNIQIGDQNFMVVGDKTACSSRRKSKNNKKPKKNIEGLYNIFSYNIFCECHLHTCTVAYSSVKAPLKTVAPILFKMLDKYISST